jgi:hypothetical protein
MKQSSSEKRVIVMVLLITLPFALAALMWCILPSGYRAFHSGQSGKMSVISEWHPLQPSIHQAIEFVHPY